MREIIFRGNTINPFDGWVYGSLLIVEDDTTEEIQYSIISGGVKSRVLTESIGQFIGLEDKKSNGIYSGDIIEMKHPYKNRSFIGEVKYLDYYFGCADFYMSHFDIPTDIFSEGTEYIEVIGNAYEHSELLTNKTKTV